MADEGTQPARTRLVEDLERALEALDPEGQDAALVGLLRLQARELDGAAALEARARRVAEEVADRDGREAALYERVEALSAALGRRQALERIGREYRAGLVELLGTPRARKAGRPAAPPEPEGQAGGALGRLRLAAGSDG